MDVLIKSQVTERKSYGIEIAKAVEKSKLEKSENVNLDLENSKEYVAEEMKDNYYASNTYL